jgi:Mn-dependent DtxR family transcriptional regulator
MDFSTIGFIRADRYRLGILEAVKDKATKKEISGRLRVPEPFLEKALGELLARGLIASDRDGFAITNKGLKILTQISKQRR